jgi:hypothetical protein
MSRTLRQDEHVTVSISLFPPSSNGVWLQGHTPFGVNSFVNKGERVSGYAGHPLALVYNSRRIALY